MKIGELARRAGVSRRMLRYYEQEGLLQPARTESGYRNYGEAEVQTAQRIRMLSSAGLKVETIRVLLPCMLGDQPIFEPCREVRTALHREVETLDEKLRDLSESRKIIKSYLHGLAPTGN
ncbi:MerR family transcriptional regulator [Burkholderia vietnamiensis]|uniref:MerR family transcriptional regulator n=1 Tax=Burkholderia cepacia complex TaxID=87882 RepID=UPI0007610390|nr:MULTISPECIES: MerR family transcriptional regulator [Burkholderia cepacia complex]KVS41305.1 MerR family transcriptional regulator [Burkholderia vietnamiensis]MBU9637269.1 MerR family transcriptional regulator [Burkholderia multivorans]PRF09787.1 MerR family transcriptional regulator [Burkholderia multivorans]PRG41492.1 MerR family transcriptional regulator [Burkholderia multivorans]